MYNIFALIAMIFGGFMPNPTLTPQMNLEGQLVQQFVSDLYETNVAMYITDDCELVSEQKFADYQGTSCHSIFDENLDCGDYPEMDTELCQYLHSFNDGSILRQWNVYSHILHQNGYEVFELVIWEDYSWCALNKDTERIACGVYIENHH